MSSADEVLTAADSLVRAFGRHDKEAYFASFAPDATFCFYNVPKRLHSRRAYEELWSTWERNDGFQVLSCASRNPHVQMLGEVSIFTHEVHTTTRINETPEAVDERETIVFARQPDGTWLAVHEHLSPMPPTPAGSSTSQ
jgi:ketosteroid isomerase-like protein